MAHPFVVHVAGLRKTAGTRWHEVRQGVVPDLRCGSSFVPDDADCEADVTLEAVSGAVEVTGTVTAPWQGECRRCLAVARGQLRIPVRELYTVGGDGEDTYPLRADTLDLEPLVHDAVLLELPPAPLCGPDCRGLCPWCGANRNETDCDCRPPADERWAALDALRVPDGGRPDPAN